MQKEAKRLVREDKTVAFVPTMGYLHEGHLTLMREGRNRGDVLVISIFVNPTQFGPKEDFATYPRDFERDLTLARSVDVDLVFAPNADEIYEPGYQTYVTVEAMSRRLCGVSRPGHFRGVTTVVTKLFNIVQPRVAIFGEKDYQQLAIIRRLVKDLHFDIEIVGVPTVRESNGLALSSRNTYLSSDERPSALALYESLRMVEEKVRRGERDCEYLIGEASRLIGSYAHTRIDYVAFCDPNTLEDVKQIKGPTLMALAVWVGKTRLIDNRIIG